MSQLFTRYSQGQIYTYIGDILLAVNPFTPLTIYNEEVRETSLNFTHFSINGKRTNILNFCTSVTFAVVRQNKKICVFPVTRPTLIFSQRP